MSAEENKAFIKHYFETMSRKDKLASELKKFVSESDQALIQHILALEVAFPRYQLTIEDMIAEGDKVVVRATFNGIQKGDLTGIPATGKEVVFPLIVIYRVANGKIAEHWLLADQLGMMQQLGVMA